MSRCLHRLLNVLIGGLGLTFGMTYEWAAIVKEKLQSTIRHGKVIHRGRFSPSSISKRIADVPIVLERCA